MTSLCFRLERFLPQGSDNTGGDLAELANRIVGFVAPPTPAELLRDPGADVSELGVAQSSWAPTGGHPYSAMFGLSTTYRVSPVLCRERDLFNVSSDMYHGTKEWEDSNTPAWHR